MKALSLLCVFACSLLYTEQARAYFNSHINDLTYQIEPNQTTRSKPTSVKLASVSFLKTDKGIDFSTGSLDVRSECGALGYAIPVSQCSGDMKPSHLCSSELTKTGADQYTSGCCHSKVYSVDESTECSNNASKLMSDRCFWGGSWKYRCACDRGVYPYSTISGEECSSNDFNESKTCKAYEPSTNKTESYYIGCCPSAQYKPCDGQHQIGSGGSCQSSKDHQVKYENCTCAGHYDTICTNGKLIDVTNYCSLDGVTKFTTESNCESNCTKTIETNVDEYLFNNSWHCLYRKDGATIKSVENTSGVCGEYDETRDKGEYDECAKQGFVKSIDDCYDTDVILKCPNDTSKVWCLDGKYCTGYDVGSYNSVNYCTTGADIEFCSTSDQGTRCHYKNEDCNCMWNDGAYDSSLANCVSKFSSIVEAKRFFGFPPDTEKGENYELSEDGKDLTCCKSGYKMESGRCVENTCDRGKYPYDQRPPVDAGEIEECRQADANENLGYKAYFGYRNCNSDISEGGLWIEDPNNSRRCICARDGQGGRTYYLPFSVAQYYSTNGDTSDNYANIGFYSGFYGDYKTCTDAEGSYYGYTMCYVGRTMKTVEEVTINGKCMIADAVSYNVKYCFGSEHRINVFLTLNGLPPLSSFVTEPRNSEQAYCVHKYTHCQTQSGQPLGDEDVCALVPEGCNYGYEAACNECYHIDSVKKGEDGLYHLNDYIIGVNSGRNDGRYFRFEKCPTGLKKGGNATKYHSCYAYCYDTDLSACVGGDVLAICPAGQTCTRGDTLATGAIKTGSIYYNDVSSRKILLVHGFAYTKKTWDDAMASAATYAPVGLTNDPVFGAGHWRLPSYTGTVIGPTSNRAELADAPYDFGVTAPGGVYSSSMAEGGWTSTPTGHWTSREYNASNAYMSTTGDSPKVSEKTNKYYAIFVLDLNY